MEWLVVRCLFPRKQGTIVGHGQHPLSVVDLPTVKENKMRILIAGADRSTLSILGEFFLDRGHESEITRNGVECMSGLRGFIPDLLVMKFDILWGGCDGVMETMNGDPRLAEIPVVLFTETYKQPALKAYPRIIARMTHPFQSRELSRLDVLLNEMESTRVVASFAANGNG